MGRKWKKEDREEEGGQVQKLESVRKSSVRRRSMRRRSVRRKGR